MTTKTRLLLPLFLCIFNFSVCAQDSLQNDFIAPISAEQIYLLSNLHENTALAIFLNHSILTFKVSNLYSLNELTDLNINYFPKWKANCFHLGVGHFGFSQFGSLDFKIGYSTIWNQKISFSLDFIYRLNHAVNAPAKNAVTFSCSFFGKINNKTGMGFYIFNPISSTYLESKRFKIPITMKVLGIYSLNKNMIITGELTKELPGYLDFIFSTLLHHKNISFSFDFSRKSIGFGFYFQYKKILLHTKYSYHYLLGGSPEMQLTYNWK